MITEQENVPRAIFDDLLVWGFEKVYIHAALKYFFGFYHFALHH
jgi:hypothetical protein